MGEIGIILSDLNTILRDLNIILEKHMWEGVGLVLLSLYGPVYLRYLFRSVLQYRKRKQFEDSNVWSQ